MAARLSPWVLLLLVGGCGGDALPRDAARPAREPAPAPLAIGSAAVDAEGRRVAAIAAGRVLLARASQGCVATLPEGRVVDLSPSPAGALVTLQRGPLAAAFVFEEGGGAACDVRKLASFPVLAPRAPSSRGVLAIATGLRQVNLYGARTTGGSGQLTFPGVSSIAWLGWSSDGARLAARGAEGSLEVVDTSTGARVGFAEPIDGELTPAPDWRSFALQRIPGAFVEVWSLDSRTHAYAFVRALRPPRRHDAFASAAGVAWRPDGQALLWWTVFDLDAPGAQDVHAELLRAPTWTPGDGGVAGVPPRATRVLLDAEGRVFVDEGQGLRGAGGGHLFPAPYAVAREGSHVVSWAGATADVWDLSGRHRFGFVAEASGPRVLPPRQEDGPARR